MVAPDEEDRDRAITQPCHLLAKEQASVVIGPVTIVEITHNHDEGHVLCYSQINKVFERPPGCAPTFGDWGSLIALESSLRAIEVNVSRMQKLEHRLEPSLSLAL